MTDAAKVKNHPTLRSRIERALPILVCAHHPAHIRLEVVSRIENSIASAILVKIVQKPAKMRTPLTSSRAGSGTRRCHLSEINHTTRGELDAKGSVLCRSPRSSRQPSATIRNCCAKRAPADPPSAKVIRSSARDKRHVRRPWRPTVFGSRLVKMRWLQSFVAQKKRRTLSSILTGMPSHGRSVT
jgi:hypothetical protein